MPAAKSRFRNDELMLIHVSDSLISMLDLVNEPEVLSCIPIRYAKLIPSFPICCRLEIQFAVKPMRVGGVGNHT